MTMEMIFCTQHFSNWKENQESWGPDVPMIEVVGIRPLTLAYQIGFEQSTAEILAFVHDDVTVYDPQWQVRVLAEFADPTVGLVGFGGSTGHGHADIYRKPYQWEDVGREGTFYSNLRNAHQHGTRLTGAHEAKCLDGFAMFVRRSVLQSCPWMWCDGPNKLKGYWGWPQETPIAYWAYDYWLSCETRRQGLRIRVVGVDCAHTCPAEYRSYVVDEDCQAAHRWLYENYRDTFPARCG